MSISRSLFDREIMSPPKVKIVYVLHIPLSTQHNSLAQSTLLDTIKIYMEQHLRYITNCKGLKQIFVWDWIGKTMTTMIGSAWVTVAPQFCLDPQYMFFSRKESPRKGWGRCTPKVWMCVCVCACVWVTIRSMVTQRQTQKWLAKNFLRQHWLSGDPDVDADSIARCAPALTFCVLSFVGTIPLI